MKVDPSPQRFSRGQELRLNCTAGGHPQPHSSWRRWGWALQQNERYPWGPGSLQCWDGAALALCAG